jgi:hypothetical protein
MYSRVSHDAYKISKLFTATPIREDTRATVQLGSQAISVRPILTNAQKACAKMESVRTSSLASLANASHFLQATRVIWNSTRALQEMRHAILLERISASL